MVRTQVIQSFVARVWLERNADEMPKWRGHIQHIQGPEEMYFQNLVEMSEFLEKVSGIPGLEFSPERGNVVSISKRGSKKDKEESDK